MECMATVYSNGCDVGVPVELSIAQPRSLNRHFSKLAYGLVDGPLARDQADDRAR